MEEFQNRGDKDVGFYRLHWCSRVYSRRACTSGRSVQNQHFMGLRLSYIFAAIAGLYRPTLGCCEVPSLRAAFRGFPIFSGGLHSILVPRLAVIGQLTKWSTGRQKRTAFGALGWRSGAGYLWRYGSWRDR